MSSPSPVTLRFTWISFREACLVRTKRRPWVNGRSFGKLAEWPAAVCCIRDGRTAGRNWRPPTSPLVEEALDKAVSGEVGGSPVRVFSAEHLAAIALQTGRAKDKARLLQFVESGVLDASKFEQLVIRHGLADDWEKFGRQFLGDAS